MSLYQLNISEMLKKDEGLKLKPYYCTSNKLTIGVGRNIEDNGISEDEALYMLENDIKGVKQEVLRCFPWLKSHDEVRQAVIINMAFNLGLPTLKKFKNMLHHLQLKNFDQASIEMLDSRWALQVKGRATRLSEMMRTGEVDNYYL